MTTCGSIPRFFHPDHYYVQCVCEVVVDAWILTLHLLVQTDQPISVAETFRLQTWVQSLDMWNLLESSAAWSPQSKALYVLSNSPRTTLLHFSLRHSWGQRTTPSGETHRLCLRHTSWVEVCVYVYMCVRVLHTLQYRVYICKGILYLLSSEAQLGWYWVSTYTGRHMHIPTSAERRSILTLLCERLDLWTITRESNVKGDRSRGMEIQRAKFICDQTMNERKWLIKLILHTGYK